MIFKKKSHIFQRYALKYLQLKLSVLVYVCFKIIREQAAGQLVGTELKEVGRKW